MRFCSYLRNRGVLVGNGTCFRPKTTHIDLTRPCLITIGDNCYFNEKLSILTHDYVTHTFINSGREFLPSSGKVVIGNNVSTGEDVLILKGVHIGDNVFIGAHSVVTKDLPSNTIAVGSPARVLCTLEEYYNRRKKECINEAFEYARSIQERYNRKPDISDFWEEFVLFVSGNEIDNYPEIPIRKQLGSSYNEYKKSHIAEYKTFEQFLKAAGIE